MIVLLFTVSIYLVYYDLKYKRVPNLINLFLFILVVISKIIDGDIYPALLSGIVAFSTFLIINIITKGKMGIGDTKYTSIIAIYFGYEFWLYSIIYCSIYAIVISISLYLLKKIQRDTKIPFIPFLFLGWITQLILSTYIKL